MYGMLFLINLLANLWFKWAKLQTLIYISWGENAEGDSNIDMFC